MTGPTNLTDRIAGLREKKNASSVLNSPDNTEITKLTPPSIKVPKQAFDYFASFTYFLFLIAILGQLFLIISLEFF